MAKVRQVLLHVVVETAGAQRKCHHKPAEHVIAKGVKCLVVKEAGRGSKKNYCPMCALEIIATAESDLQVLREHFAVAPVTAPRMSARS